MTNPPAPTWPGLPIEPTATVWHQSRDGQLVDGRYRIERLLGIGGMGEVYVAQQLSIGRSVALKLLRSEMARRPQARERFYIEARAASRLNHPNIVTVFDFGAAKEGLFLVMELIVGDSLPAIMVDGPLDWRRAARLIRQAADALAHAHQNGIIHCDIKTENLMLIGRGQPDEHLKVLDFGIARIAHAGVNEPTPGTAVGTPMAMAPEVILGDPPTPQADIYALGVVFFELLTKLQPYEPTSVQRLVQQKLFSPVKDFDIPGAPAHVVTELRALIAQALAPRPDLRPRNCEEVRDRLDRLLEPAAHSVEILGLQSDGGSTTGPQEFDPKKGVAALVTALCASPDLPVFATVVQAIDALCQNPMASSDIEIERLMNEIGLAQKVLRIANSPFYRGGHPEITRVSRAVMVMGLEQVRRVALSLPMLGSLDSDDPALIESAFRSLASAILTRELAEGQAGVDKEDASTGALLRNLSRHLLQTRLPALSQTVRERAAVLHEDEAAREILGVTFEDLNVLIAAKMDFPERLRRLLGSIDAATADATETKLRALSAFGSEMAALLQSPESPHRQERLGAIVRTYAQAITLEPSKIKSAMERTAVIVVQHAQEAGVGIEVAQTLVRRVEAITQPPKVSAQRLAAVAPQILRSAGEGGRLEMVVYKVLQALNVEAGFDHAVFCLRHFRSGEVTGRLSIGTGGQALLDAFHFKVGVAGDPFSEGLELGEDRYALPGTDLKTITPDWHRAKSSAAGFAFLPLRIRGQAVGVIFAEQVVAGPRVWHLPEAAPLISTLRDSVVDALRRMKS